MTEDQFDKIIKNAADHYNVPPLNPPLDQMWTAIEAESFGARILRTPLVADAPQGRLSDQGTRVSLVNNPWLRMAAVLVLGVAIGRVSMRPAAAVDTTVVAAAPANATASYDLSTERYLGQAVTLLATLPNQLQSGGADSTFVVRASESLAALRLLMDSPAASNPRLRALFEDLELVLVQVVQMPAGGSTTDAKLIRQAMQERDVMPRLFDAVAETPNF